MQSKEDIHRGADGKFLFKLAWPMKEVRSGLKNYNIWKQTSNPMTSPEVEGYEPIDVNYEWTWHGLRQTTGVRRDYSVLQGSHAGWLYAVGCIQPWVGRPGFPGPGTAEYQIELWVYPNKTGKCLALRFLLDVSRG